MKRGRPFEPGNKFGRGRPKGSRNKRTLLLQELLDEHSPALLRKALVMAMQGDGPLLRTLLERSLPRYQDPPVRLGRFPMNTIDGLLQAQERVMKKVASGDITPAQAKQLDDLLETRRQLIVTQDHEKRVSTLEAAHHLNDSN